jgi:crotonobetainyl-CoA:carnitine CoA-transferase CaiB-like acyl-CoA transferase
MLRDIPHPLGGDLKQVVSPLNFRNAPLSYDRAPPLLGQHTDEVLAELGLGADERAHLRRQGVLGPSAPDA